MAVLGLIHSLTKMGIDHHIETDNFCKTIGQTAFRRMGQKTFLRWVLMGFKVILHRR
jgi:hypothetical protein